MLRIVTMEEPALKILFTRICARLRSTPNLVNGKDTKRLREAEEHMRRGIVKHSTLRGASQAEIEKLAWHVAGERFGVIR